MLIIGMMSGTSADGIDAALVAFENGELIEVHETVYHAFPKSIQNRINALAQKNDADLNDTDVKELDHELALFYIDAVKKLLSQTATPQASITAIANHGQTIAHRPEANPPFSLQIGNNQSIADSLNIPVISQFRQADLAVGGQGAPLMPAFHNVLIRNKALNSGENYVLNLGGIANISVIKNSRGYDTVGFDTGPANTLMNQWIKKHKGLDYDKNGAWALSGAANDALLQDLMNDPYFLKPFPKSTGPDYFNLEWLNAASKLVSDSEPKDVQATLLAFTVESIALALTQSQARQGDIFVCGGGVHNQALMAKLQSSLDGFRITTSNELGVPPDWVEAVGFAWLGACYLNKTPSNCPSVTGAHKEVCLGELFMPKSNDAPINSFPDLGNRY